MGQASAVQNLVGLGSLKEDGGLVEEVGLRILEVLVAAPHSLVLASANHHILAAAAGHHSPRASGLRSLEAFILHNLKVSTLRNPVAATVHRTPMLASTHSLDGSLAMPVPTGSLEVEHSLTVEPVGTGPAHSGIAVAVLELQETDHLMGSLPELEDIGPEDIDLEVDIGPEGSLVVGIVLVGSLVVYHCWEFLLPS